MRYVRPQKMQSLDSGNFVLRPASDKDAPSIVDAVRQSTNGLGLARVEIVVAVNNEPSLSVARRAGATLECTARNRLQLHGKAVDACVFSFIPVPGA